MKSCDTPLEWEKLVAYWAGDMSVEETGEVDEHLMGCASCTAQSARVAAVREAVRAMVPPIVTRERAERLRASGVSTVDNTLVPGERKLARFSAGLDFMFHRLRGLDLTNADRVRVTIRVEETGDVVHDDPNAPFEAAGGEVILACQKHFTAFPPNLVVEVRAHDPSGREQVALYPIPHVFEG